MKNKKILKKVLALICSATLLVECFSGYATSSKAANTTTIPADLKDYTRITMENFGLTATTDEAGTNYENGEAGSYTGEINKTYLDVDVNFHGNDSGNQYFQYLYESDWTQFMRATHWGTGVSIYEGANNSNSLWIAGDADQFYNFKLAVDTSVNAEDTTKLDIVMQVWVDNVSQGKLEFTASSEITKNIYIASGLTIRTPVVETTEPEPEPEGSNDFTGYNRITMKNFGLDASTEESGTVYAQSDNLNGVSGTYTGNGLNKTYLDVDIKFNFVSTNYFHFFGSSDWANNIRFESVKLNDDTVLAEHKKK